MKKVAFCMMCVLSVFISCDSGDDDDHHHHHDPNLTRQSEQRHQEEKVCFSSEDMLLFQDAS